MAQVERLPSKIVQVSGAGNDEEYIAYVLCEDGSMWVYNHSHSEYRRIHPPHKPPTLAADLAEALEVLRALWSETEPDSSEGAKAYGAAARVLQKHGVPTT